MEPYSPAPSEDLKSPAVLPAGRCVGGQDRDRRDGPNAPSPSLPQVLGSVQPFG